jgi:hypothetical protein
MKVKKRALEPECLTQAGKRPRLLSDDSVRNPRKTRLDDLTCAEIASLLKLSEIESVVLYLDHPRVREYPYDGNLIAYLLGQIRAIQETKTHNLYQSDRFTGLTTLLSNITSLFYPDPVRDLEQLPHFLHSNGDLNRRLVAMTVEYFLKELPDENDGPATASSGEFSDEIQNSKEKKLVSNIGNLLTVFHHLLSFEAKLPPEERYLKQESLTLHVSTVAQG